MEEDSGSKMLERYTCKGGKFFIPNLTIGPLGMSIVIAISAQANHQEALWWVAICTLWLSVLFANWAWVKLYEHSRKLEDALAEMGEMVDAKEL